MKIIKGNAKCAGCTACMGICPVGAISMREGQDGFLYPYVDNQKCINCGKCISVCPMNGTVKSSEAPEVYALISRDLKKRMHSSSGETVRKPLRGDNRILNVGLSPKQS